MKNTTRIYAFLLLGGTLFSSCASLHHVQIGQIDTRGNNALIPFEVMVSETGVNTEDIKAIARSTNTRAGDQAGEAAEILSLFQMGPRTGNLVYQEGYAKKLLYMIHEKCPSGKITGLQSIRETRKYPVISGEIVKVTGYCIKARRS